MISHHAVFSPDRRFRYRLERGWFGGAGVVAFIMLNPSTADERQDDPTIRRCIAYAKTWGRAGLLVGNLFAYRATDPADLRAAGCPVGPDNDRHLRQIAQESETTVLAWGAHPAARDRARDVLDILADASLSFLSLTKLGAPAHPLYLRRDLTPQPWRHA